MSFVDLEAATDDEILDAIKLWTASTGKRFVLYCAHMNVVDAEYNAAKEKFRLD
jgi:hypothetical protein